MCGICGIAYADRARRVEPALLRRMCASLEHRGPDDEDVRVLGRVGLGHRRLSIVDLAHGRQPMANEDETVWIAFNGEIYNHADFRASLVSRGHRYRTRCDTEAIVHLFEERGAACLPELRGMFAFAIWDEMRGTLILARDHTGIKPLYYAALPDGTLVHASEPKGIFASGLVSPEIDEGAIAEFFALGHVSGSRTLYRDVRRLAPGHLLEWRDGAVEVRPFWKLPEHDERRRAGSLAQAAEEFWTLFRDSVESQLMSDVPLGVFLSGGLDSSLIAAAATEAGAGRLRTFSVGFRGAAESELSHARFAATALGTDHHEVDVGSREFFEALPRLTAHRDQPLPFSASIPLYFVSRLAAAHVKVVLTGEGSDELFAGYGRYPRALWNRGLGRMLDGALPASLRRSLAVAANELGDGYGASRLKRSCLVHDSGFAGSYLEAFADFDAAHRRRLLRSPGRAYDRSLALLDPGLLERAPLEALLRFDQLTYLEELLMKQDQMSMAASIESRVPFLDHRLVEWAARLPARFKLRRGIGKAVVRAAAARHLPRSVAEGKKRGFPVPIAAWLRGHGGDWVREHLPEHGDPWLRRAYVERLLAEHGRGLDHSARLWRVLAFQVWRRGVDAARVDRPRASDASPLLHAQVATEC